MLKVTSKKMKSSEVSIMGRNVAKPGFRDSNKARLKPVSLATEIS